MPDLSGAAPAPRTINLSVVSGGALFTAEQVRELLELINEQLGDGANLNVTLSDAVAP